MECKNELCNNNNNNNFNNDEVTDGQKRTRTQFKHRENCFNGFVHWPRVLGNSPREKFQAQQAAATVDDDGLAMYDRDERCAVFSLRAEQKAIAAMEIRRERE